MPPCVYRGRDGSTSSWPDTVSIVTVVGGHQLDDANGRSVRLSAAHSKDLNDYEMLGWVITDSTLGCACSARL